MTPAFDLGSLSKKKKGPSRTIPPTPPPAKNKIPRTVRKKTPTTFNTFMSKLEASNTASAKHLKDKLSVKGKKKAVNKERVIRVIRDVLEVINE